MKDELSYLYDYDECKFRSSYAKTIENANQEQLVAKLMFVTHSLEKGLSNDSFEVGHGLRSVQLLADIMDVYESKTYDKTHYAYIAALSTLGVFYSHHKNTIYKKDIEDTLGHFLEEVVNCNSEIGGTITVFAKEKLNTSKKNFKDLARDRYSVRAYKDKPVSREIVKEVVSIAMKTPTVCNRQSIRVRVMNDKSIIKKVLDIQGGILHYETPPNLFLITADDRSYVGPHERNQGFIDGGLFAMSIIYALEYKSIAACALNAMFTEKTEREIRRLLSIDDNEKLVTFISFDYFKDKSNTCKSFRYPTEYVISEINKLHEHALPTEMASSNVQNLAKSMQSREKLHIVSQIKNALDEGKKIVRIRTRLKYLQQKNKKQQQHRHEAAMYDGAIVTLPGNYNYGNLVQKYALQKFLKQQGLSFRIIDMIRINDDSDPKIYGAMQRFFDTKLDTMPYEQVRDILYKNYIVGSDQVWRNWYEWEQGLFYDYFLHFVKNKKARKIAYAASFGVGSLADAGFTDEVFDRASSLLSQFDAISVREESAIAMTRQLTSSDRDVQLVLDPTLLLSQNDYSELIDESNEKDTSIPRLFGYVLDKNGNKGRLLQKMADHYDGDYNIISPNSRQAHDSVELWLKSFRDAEFVITDSFHGMVFSIINNTPFVVFANKKRGVSRMENILELLGIHKNRLIYEDSSGEFDIDSLTSIDWDNVNNKIASLQVRSKDWLLTNAKKRE